MPIDIPEVAKKLNMDESFLTKLYEEEPCYIIKPMKDLTPETAHADEVFPPEVVDDE